jgi:uncharacterized C2H2 Zn-finger protein
MSKLLDPKDCYAFKSRTGHFTILCRGCAALFTTQNSYAEHYCNKYRDEVIKEQVTLKIHKLRKQTHLIPIN